MKKKVEELQKEALDARSDRTEIMVEMEKVQTELQQTKERLAKAEAAAAAAKPEDKLAEGQVAAVPEKKEEKPAGELNTSPKSAEAKLAKVEGSMDLSESELKKKAFELKKQLDSVKMKLEDTNEENSRLKEDNDKYTRELGMKGERIKKLELTCNELVEEKTFLEMKMKNVDFIQRQDDALKPRLSTIYAGAVGGPKGAAPHAADDPFASGNKQAQDFFKPTDTEVIADKPNVISEGGDEGQSLAKQMGIDESGMAVKSTLDNVLEHDASGNQDDNMISLKDLAPEAKEEMKETAPVSEAATAPEQKQAAAGQEKIKVRPSNIFQTRNYFKNRLGMDAIAESEEGRTTSGVKPAVEEAKTEEKKEPLPAPAEAKVEEKKEEVSAPAPEEKKPAEEKKEEQPKPVEAKTEEKKEEEKKPESVPAPVVEEKKEEEKKEEEKKPEPVPAPVVEAKKEEEKKVEEKKAEEKKAEEKKEEEKKEEKKEPIAEVKQEEQPQEVIEVKKEEPLPEKEAKMVETVVYPPAETVSPKAVPVVRFCSHNE